MRGRLLMLKDCIQVLKLFPEVEIVGAVTSAVQVAVRDAVEVLPAGINSRECSCL
jgi:hypothetical protein